MSLATINSLVAYEIATYLASVVESKNLHWSLNFYLTIVAKRGIRT